MFLRWDDMLAEKTVTQIEELPPRFPLNFVYIKTFNEFFRTQVLT